jgi:hypothetical protein
MATDSVDTLVAAWFAGEHSMFDACTEEPELAWSAIQEILRRKVSDEEMALLAAGPMETLLAWHGDAFIDRVERQAATDARFNYLLGGVWRNTMRDEIWERIQCARKAVW